MASEKKPVPVFDYTPGSKTHGHAIPTAKAESICEKGKCFVVVGPGKPHVPVPTLPKIGDKIEGVTVHGAVKVSGKVTIH